MKHSLRILPATLLALFMAGAAQATLLSTLLLTGGSITAGDKVFDQWSSVYLASDPLRQFNAGNIDVTALNDGGLDPGPGLRFTVTNGELDVAGDGIFAYLDLKLGFHVSVLDPTLRIKDNSLGIFSAGTGRTVDGSNDLGMYIHEDAGTSAGASDLSTLSVELSHLDDVDTTSLADAASFAQQDEIWVTKNILVWSVDIGDSASLTGFDQRFSQASTTVPEPATYALVGLALVGSLLPGALRRRRKPD